MEDTNILFHIGGNYFWGASEIYLRGKEKLIWVDFDQEGHIMINFDLKSSDGNLFFSIRNNDWIISTLLNDIESPTTNPPIQSIIHQLAKQIQIHHRRFNLRIL